MTGTGATAGTTNDRVASTRPKAAVTTTSAELPYTGLNTLWLLLGGLALIALGAALRRFASPRSGIR